MQLENTIEGVSKIPFHKEQAYFPRPRLGLLYLCDSMLVYNYKQRFDNICHLGAHQKVLPTESLQQKETFGVMAFLSGRCLPMPSPPFCAVISPKKDIKDCVRGSVWREPRTVRRKCISSWRSAGNSNLMKDLTSIKLVKNAGNCTHRIATVHMGWSECV